MPHILLSTAFTYKRRREITPPLDFTYDKQIGAWLSLKDSSLLVNDKDFPTIASKKKDIETGEDSKGQ
jgi:hypothetical protein